MIMIDLLKKTLLKCPLCDLADYPVVYLPQKSSFDAKVHLCMNCSYLGLVPSEKSSQQSLRSNILSCDADYSTIRVGKEQMLEQSWAMIKKHTDLTLCKRILDLSSARGHFAKKVLSEVEQTEVTCLEPDVYMTQDYSSIKHLKIIHSIHDLDDEGQKFDLIYSCHSLEHYRDPLKNLRLMLNCLSVDGSIYVEVPNAAAMNSSFVIEEFFYDQHKSYFFEPVLARAIESVGLKICHSESDGSAIRLILKKNGARDLDFESDAMSPTDILSQVENYAETLRENRKRLPSIVLSWGLDCQSKSLGIVGCGRMLDALVTYGGLKIEDKTQLYDSILSKIDYFRRGNRVMPLSSIADHCPDQVIIAANSSVNQLTKLVNEFSPDSTVFRYF
jgi:SAM-dependent methyltransferase